VWSGQLEVPLHPVPTDPEPRSARTGFSSKFLLGEVSRKGFVVLAAQEVPEGRPNGLLLVLRARRRARR